MIKKAILVVSFGTSFNETRAKTLDRIEMIISDNFADYEVRRAFTSEFIIRKLRERDNIMVDNLQQALQKLNDEKFDEVIIQPTYIIKGKEFDNMISVASEFNKCFTKLIIGDVLLSSNRDLEKIITALTKITEYYDNDGTAIIFMGHGVDHSQNSMYSQLNEQLNSRCSNYFVATFEAQPSIFNILPKIKNNGYKKAVLHPLMISAGDHAVNVMAGDDEDSWKVILKNEGLKVEPIMRGLGEYTQIQQIFMRNVQNAIDRGI